MSELVGMTLSFWVTWRDRGSSNPNSKRFSELDAAKKFAREQAKDPELLVRLLMLTEKEYKTNGS